MLNHIWWLSVMVWSILETRADQIKTAKVTVKEGTQKDELILDLIQGTWSYFLIIVFF